MKKLMIAAAFALISLVGCMGPTQRHAELEWELRHEMPTWGPDEWNAWEAELASALDKPFPDPQMFPEDEPEEPEGDE